MVGMITDEELMVAAYRKRMRKLDLMVEWLAASAASRSGHSAEEHIILAQGYAEGVIEREDKEAEQNGRKD